MSPAFYVDSSQTSILQDINDNRRYSDRTKSPQSDSFHVRSDADGADIHQSEGRRISKQNIEV